MGAHSWSTTLSPLPKLIEGHHIGIVANQTPVIFTNESKKAVQFIRLCNQASIPILFMHNVTGFMVGKKTEREGLVKSGALFVDAVSRSQVPHLSIICGASYGAGNYAVLHPSIPRLTERCADAHMTRDFYSVGPCLDVRSWALINSLA
jgi:acetyl-CoA carboxylase carboxyltransferase component